MSFKKIGSLTVPGSLVKSGSFTHSGGINTAIAKFAKLISLQPAKKVVITFDPFGPNSLIIRNFIYIIHNKKRIQTNPYCKILTEVVCDRREPTVDISLNNGESVLLKCNNFNVLDMIKVFNQHVSILAPKEEVAKTFKK